MENVSGTADATNPGVQQIKRWNLTEGIATRWKSSSRVSDLNCITMNFNLNW